VIFGAIAIADFVPSGPKIRDARQTERLFVCSFGSG
jgi:hypothetical protein